MNFTMQVVRFEKSEILMVFYILLIMRILPFYKVVRGGASKNVNN